MSVETGGLRVVGSEATDQPIVDSSEGAVAPGRYIREHRQRRGLSIEQLAAATNIPRNSLQLLEDGQLEQLPGPVFVRGFLRCCARALQLDPQHVIELLYEQERESQRAARREPAATARKAAAPRSGSRGGLLSGEIASGSVRRVLEQVPPATLVLWLVVVVVVAMLVIAAFQLAGGGASSLPHT